ncbi:MAG: hypothetical protein R3B07_17015 [Polyangiaceae bacterium]
MLALLPGSGRDLDPHLKVAAAALPEHAEFVTGLLTNAGEKLAKPAEVDTQLSKLSMEARVCATSLPAATSAMGAASAFCRFAMNWLFAPERPYFSVE